MKTHQEGFMLIEAMIAVLIFCLGVLGMVAMGGAAMGAQSDARYRADAVALADEMAAKIALNVDRSSAATIATSLAAFQHLPTGSVGGQACVFSGAASTQPDVLNWVDSVKATGTGVRRLPGATTATEQIKVTTTTFNQVQITVCWKAPADVAMRHHTLIAYIN